MQFKLKIEKKIKRFITKIKAFDIALFWLVELN